MSAAWDNHINQLNSLFAGGSPSGSPAWQAHMGQLSTLMAPPMAAAPAAAPAPVAAPAARTMGGNDPNFDWGGYLNALNLQQTGLGPNGENVTPMGASWGSYDARMPEFGNTGYAGGPPGTGPSLSDLGFSGLNVPGWAGGLLGGVAGTALAGPLGGLLGAFGGRALAGLMGDFFGGDGMATGNELNSLNAQAASNVENMAGSGFGDARGL